MEETATRILNRHRIMAISTLRPDGWPQTTIVGYANQGFVIYFMVFRSSQKFANIQKDDRISIAVAAEPADLGELQAVYAAAHASEITDAKEREEVWRLLMQRHPVLAVFGLPGKSDAAMMKAVCKFVSVLDYRQGFGHSEDLTVDVGDAGEIQVQHLEDHAGSGTVEAKQPTKAKA